MKNILSIIATILFLTTTAQAASRPNTTTFTLGGGYEFFASKRNIQNTAVPLAMLGYNFTERWGIEALFGVINSTSHQNATYGEHVHGNLFLIDGLYHFSCCHHIEPFVLAGVGITGLDPNGNDARNEGNINAGAGILWFANEVVALRLEARDLYTITGGKNDVLVDGGVTFVF